MAMICRNPASHLRRAEKELQGLKRDNAVFQRVLRTTLENRHQFGDRLSMLSMTRTSTGLGRRQLQSELLLHSSE